MTLGKPPRFLAASGLALALSLGACAGVQDNAPPAGTLRAVPHAGLATLDPITTTAYINRTHGYLVYDTLFALDQNFEPQPQMVETFTISPDGRTYTFRLRDGLKWHDGTPVTAEDCVASLRRWGRRDGTGQALFSSMESLTAQDPQTIVMRLRRPFHGVLEALGKISSNVPFMMPRRIAETDPNTPITDATGSGPFRFSREDWQPGRRAVYIRNDAYVPRAEPASLAAGSRAGQMPRIEWVSYPSQEAAVEALGRGEVQYLESPSFRLLPRLRELPGVRTAFSDPLGNVGMAVFNHEIAPFNNAGVRRAVLMAMNQEDYMAAAVGDRTMWRTCYSVFPCDTPMANEAGNQVMRTANVEAARAALRRAGYRGAPVVLMNPTDNAVISAFTRVSAERLREIGMNVQVEDMTWEALVQRRNTRRGAGAWNMFHTWWVSADLLDPTKIAFSGNPQTGWIGWPRDPQLERLRASYVAEQNPARRRAIAERVQQRVLVNANFAILGQFYEPIAFRDSVTGLQSPIQMYYRLGVRN